MLLFSWKEHLHVYDRNTIPIFLIASGLIISLQLSRGGNFSANFSHATNAFSMVKFRTHTTRLNLFQACDTGTSCRSGLLIWNHWCRFFVSVRSPKRPPRQGSGRFERNIEIPMVYSIFVIPRVNIFPEKLKYHYLSLLLEVNEEEESVNSWTTQQHSLKLLQLSFWTPHQPGDKARYQARSLSRYPVPMAFFFKKLRSVGIKENTISCLFWAAMQRHEL